MSERRHPLVLPVLFLLVWLVLTEVLLPGLVTWLYTSERFVDVKWVTEARAGKTLEYYLESLARRTRWVPVAVLGWFVVALATRSRHYFDKHVGRATPGTLGAIRALVCAILLISAMWEDLPSTAWLPRDMLREHGVLILFHMVPGFDALVASPIGLWAWQTATIVALVLAMLGAWTRWSLPAGAFGYLVLGGLMREYAWFYHTGLVPLLVAVVLCFTPCSDGFSIDRRLRVRSGELVPAADVPLEVYGWSRYACWLVLALVYVESGMSKLRRGGLEWFEPDNLRAIVLKDTLRPMEFDFRLGLELATAPDWVVIALALTAVAGEVLFGLVLVSRVGRWILPAVMIAMHLGIVLLQNVLFFDLILLLLIFYDFSAVGTWLTRRWRVASSTPAAAMTSAPWPKRVRVIASVMLTCWMLRIEFYPFTAMPMYSQPQLTGEIAYERVLATRASGEVVRAPIEEAIGAMSDGRYRRVVRRSFSAGEREVAEHFLEACARRYDARAEPAHRIVSFEVQARSWNFRAEPADPARGEVLEAWTYEVEAGEP